MADSSQFTHYSRHLLSKSLQQSASRKTQSKNKKEQPWRMAVDVDDQIFGLNQIMYRSPHENVQRNQILRITAKKYQELIQPVFLQTDHSFLKLCKNGLFNFTKFLKIYAQSYKETEEQNEDQVYFEFGKNTIPYAQQKKLKELSKQIPELKLSEGVLRMRGDFQCGNLQKCIRIQRDTNIIILNNDSNTQGYTQWFHFFIQSNFKGTEMQKFIIVNIKKTIKFMEGMKLLTRSHRSEVRNHDEWSRNLDFVQFETSINSDETKKYHAIAFSISSAHLQHGLFVSLGYPYPLSRLRCLCNEMISMGTDFKIMEIGKSALQNSILVFRLQHYPKQKKRSIIILARQHASQTSSSLICEFIIKRLSLFNTFDCLTKQFDWHIIPVANPDGVILGNARTNMKGFDMNRCWAPYLMVCSPEVQCINNYLQSLDKNPEDIYIDLHSHSRDLGFFTYAHTQNYFVKTINSKMKEICPYFEPQKCKIGYDVKKRNTFRIQVQNRFKVKNTLTIQSSFYGYISKQTGQIKEFVLYDYEQMAICILESLDSYRTNEPTFNKSQKMQQICPKNLSESSSDSDPEGDYLSEQDRKQVQEHVQTQVVKKISFNSLKRNSISEKVIKNPGKTISKQKKSVNKPNVVNLYNGMNSFSIKTNGLSKSKRIMSACMKEPNLGRIEVKSIFSDRTKLQIFQNKLKSERKSCQNPFSTQNYLERKSFKNLFANANKRNEDERKQQKMMKFQSKSQPKSTVRQFPKGQNKKITTLIFPSSHKIDSQIIKELGQNLQRKAVLKAGKGYYFDRKTKINKNGRETSKTNQKIASLCDYVKQLEKTQIFF